MRMTSSLTRRQSDRRRNRCRRPSRLESRRAFRTRLRGWRFAHVERDASARLFGPRAGWSTSIAWNNSWPIVAIGENTSSTCEMSIRSNRKPPLETTDRLGRRARRAGSCPASQNNAVRRVDGLHERSERRRAHLPFHDGRGDRRVRGSHVRQGRCGVVRGRKAKRRPAEQHDDRTHHTPPHPHAPVVRHTSPLSSLRTLRSVHS